MYKEKELKYKKFVFTKMGTYIYIRNKNSMIVNGIRLSKDETCGLYTFLTEILNKGDRNE